MAESTVRDRRAKVRFLHSRMIKNNKLIFFLLFASFSVGAVLICSFYPKEQEIVFESSKKDIAPEEVSLIAVGDVSFSRGVERIILKEDNINFPFLEVADYLKSADFVFANLETPIQEGRNITDAEMIFRSPLGTEKALKSANIKVVSLANNHTMNFGKEGLSNTFSLLEKEGIKYVGAGNNEAEAYSPVYFQEKRMKFAFLAYTDPSVIPVNYEAKGERPGNAFLNIEKMKEAVAEARKNADFVIVSMHNGTEYVFYPNKSQQEFARAAIDAGADLIIGHHPHVVQTMEKYKGKYIFYSLGNFVFDQIYIKTREAVALKIYFKDKEMSKIEVVPILIEKDIWQPRILEEGKIIVERLKFPLIEKEGYYEISLTE